jgi:protein TonB
MNSPRLTNSNVQALGLSFPQALAISLFIHMAMVACWLIAISVGGSYVNSSKNDSPDPDLELYDLISEHKVTEKAPVLPEPELAPPPPPVPEPIPEPQPVPVPKEEKLPEPPKDEVVLPKPPPPKPRPKPKPKPRPRTQAKRPAEMVDSTAGQTGTSLKKVNEDDELKIYIRGVARRVQARLVYPHEAKSLALTGRTVVSFAVGLSGHIESGSLRVKSSSGHKQLDQAAMNAAKNASPFSPPMRRLEMSVTMAFDKRTL